MRSGVPDTGQVEMEKLAREGKKDRSGFCLKIGITPDSPSLARKKRELGKIQNHSREISLIINLVA